MTEARLSPLLHDDWAYVEAVALEDLAVRDFALLEAQRRAYCGERQAVEALRLLRAAEHDPSFGHPINAYRHCLQAASLAHRAGKDEAYVVMALFHDVGWTVAPATHAAFAAALIGPYLPPEYEWMLAHHDIFEDVHRASDPAIDRYRRERWRGHPAFERTAELVALFDQDAFDPAFDPMPLEAFEPMVRRLLARPPRTAPVP